MSIKRDRSIASERQSRAVELERELSVRTYASHFGHHDTIQFQKSDKNHLTSSDLSTLLYLSDGVHDNRTTSENDSTNATDTSSYEQTISRLRHVLVVLQVTQRLFAEVRH